MTERVGLEVDTAKMRACQISVRQISTVEDSPLKPRVDEPR